MAFGFDRILIVGMGLIGASFAGALKELSPSPDIIGAARSEETVLKALDMGVADIGFAVREEEDGLTGIEVSRDKRSTLEETLQSGIDLVVLAIPVENYPAWFRLLEKSGYDGPITDAGSTKEPAITAAEALLAEPARFVPGHPMAGSEVGGIDSSRKTLFNDAWWILTPTPKTDIHIFRRLHSLLTSIGARVISVDPTEHDRVTAIVSHVPHIAAAALVALAGKHMGNESELLRLAAGGFKDTTRVAAGDPALWKGIIIDNRKLITEELSEYIGILSELRDTIAEGDEESIFSALDSAAQLRRSIPSKWVPESAKLIRVRIPMDNRPGIIAEITASAGRAGCNIQAIDIDHQTESRAVLELVLTDEGDRDSFAEALKESGYVAYFKDL